MPHPVRIAISEAVMERASRSLGALRSDTCLVKRPVSTTDDIGSPVSGVYDTIASLDCRVEESPGGIVRVLGPILASVSTAAIIFERGSNVRDQDVIEVARTGNRYKVGGVSSGSSIEFETVASASRVQ